jgi:hypothetical protein
MGRAQPGSGPAWALKMDAVPERVAGRSCIGAIPLTFSPPCKAGPHFAHGESEDTREPRVTRHEDTDAQPSGPRALDCACAQSSRGGARGQARPSSRAGPPVAAGRLVSGRNLRAARARTRGKALRRRSRLTWSRGSAAQRPRFCPTPGRVRAQSSLVDGPAAPPPAGGARGRRATRDRGGGGGGSASCHPRLLGAAGEEARRGGPGPRFQSPG